MANKRRTKRAPGRRRKKKLFKWDPFSWLNLDRAKKLIKFLLWLVLIQFLVITFFVVHTKKTEQKKSYSYKKTLSFRDPSEEDVQKKPSVPISLPFKFSKRKKIAIVIDDWGYNLNNINFIEQIKEPFTLAILPHHVHSGSIAKLANNQNKQVIVHMPMEPKSAYASLENNTIMTNMNQDEIDILLESALNDIGFAKGINNHMGSKATEDEALMRIIFRFLKRNNLFFVDSWTGNSICKDLAKEMGLPFYKRSVFLDNESDSDYIKEQFRELIANAKQNGSALGIGHDRRKTLIVFKEMIPEIKDNNIDLVFVSELVK